MKLSVGRLISAAFVLAALAGPSGYVAIIVGESDKQATDLAAGPLRDNLTVQESSKELDSNSSFYYDADAYLLNKQTTTTAPPTSKQPAEARNSSDSAPVSWPEPEAPKAAPVRQSQAAEAASTAPPSRPQPQRRPSPPVPVAGAVSGRSGRMMDLDALVGDLAASRANKARSQSGERQSRQLAPNIELAPGKKLHIQGYIPILGLKDADEEPASSASANEEQLLAAATEHSRATAARQQRLRSVNQLALQQQQQFAEHIPQNWPYGQSSPGHASFNVQRYLNTEEAGGYSSNLVGLSAQQADGGGKSSSSSSVVESLKRPLKRLASSLAGGSSEHHQELIKRQQQASQNCLCVPFYMCKNGFISESSLGRSQIQQMMQQQQQQPLATGQQPRQLLEPGAQTVRGSVESMPISTGSLVTNGGQSYANSLTLVDERSFEREIITAPPPVNSSQSLDQQLEPVGQEAGKQEPVAGAELQQAPATSGAGANSSQAGDELALNTDYSQDILGRMLGLKGAAGSRASPSQPQGAGGVCGLLRTCCAIAPHSLIGQPARGEVQQFASRPANQQQAITPFQPQPQQQQLQHYQSPMLGNAPAMQMISGAASQLYQPSMSARAQQLAPMQMQAQMQMPMPMNQLYGSQSEPLAAASSSTALVHRTSNQYTAPRPPLPQLAQYARATPTNQPLQAFQQQQQAAMMAAAAAANQQLAAQMRPASVNLQKQHVGTRKLLEGRCGLRQASGINGRVQNLNYGEKTAEFGEYPAQAAILKRLNGSESLFVCSGTLISHSWLATAAHCIRKHLGNGAAELKVRLGEWDVQRDDEFYPFVERDIRDLVVHPDFVAGNLANDIALIRLDSPLDPTLPHINPACLPAADESFARQRCWVTGWGKDSFGQRGSFQAALQEVELPVLPNPVCEQALRQTRLGQHYRLHPGFLCAGGEGGRDACEGDGGSGLYCHQEGVLKVAGLVSWGIGCGEAGVPGVYVNMAHYRHWIENIISIDDDDLYALPPAAAPFGMPVNNGGLSSSSSSSNPLISERSNNNATNSAESTAGSPSTTLGEPSTLPPQVDS